MRFVRVAAAATALLLLGAATSMGSAGAASTGVGTSKASTTVVGVSLGSEGNLLDVRLLGDDAQSTIDSKTAAAPEAFSKLTAIRATSNVVEDPLTSAPLDLTIAPLESRQPGGEAEVTQSSLDLANPGVPVLSGLGDILSGNLNLAKLTSSAEASSAKSTITGSLTNAKVAGALLDAQSVANELSSVTTANEATSTRAVNVDAITVLDLSALLSGLDILLSDLTPDQLSGLIEELGIELPGIDPATTLSDLVDDIQAELVALAGLIDSTTGIDLGGAGDIIDDLGLGGVIPDTEIDDIDNAGDAVDQANALVNALQAALIDVLNTALSALDAAPLLKLDGVDVSVVTKAADTVENSSATVTGKIGAVTIGSLGLPEIDLLETADAINAKLAEIEATIGGVLGTIGVDAVDLSTLVDIAVLQKTGPTVEKVGDYVTATAGITGLTATITPPAELAALVGDIKAQTGVADTSVAALADQYDLDLAELSAAMDEFEAVLGEGVEALSGGATVNVAQVMGVSEFRSVAPVNTDDDPPLAATGANSVRLAGVGFLLLALGLGLGSWFRMPVPAWVRRRF